MNSDFEQRLTDAINDAVQSQSNVPGREPDTVNTKDLAAVLIAFGAVADPVQHQQDLTAIMEKQVRDAEAFTHEFTTSTLHPSDDLVNGLSTSTNPQWMDGIPTWHRKVTEWREVHRA